MNFWKVPLSKGMGDWEMESIEGELEKIRESFFILRGFPLRRGKPFGIREADLRLWRVADACLAHCGLVAGRSPGGDGPDVYVGTRIYRSGGHTALMGDFVRAMAELEPGAEPPRLLLTGVEGGERPADDPEALARTGIASDRCELLDRGGLAERMESLFRRVAEIGPRRIFLFHHAEDPVAAAVCRREMSPSLYLVHHADAVASCGYYFPDLRIIDLHVHAHAISHAEGMPTWLLPLTSRDACGGGVSDDGTGPLTTTACGAQHKFEGEGFRSYYGMVGFIVRASGGRHIHIGPLDESALGEIRASLDAAGAASGAFLHIPHVPDLAVALREHRCSLYIDSWPTDGARALVDAASAGVPAALYRPYHGGGWEGDPYWGAGMLTWRSPEEFEGILRRTRAELRQLGRRQREFYEEVHHPDRFCETLQGIVEGRGGKHDPLLAERVAKHRTSQIRDSIQLMAGEYHANVQARGMLRPMNDTLTWLYGRTSELLYRMAELQHRMANVFARLEFLEAKRSEHHQRMQMLNKKINKGRGKR